ncbi:uncharacterized protein BT62DRAFT_938358 [Guyanagaster necrorhizus]|uniref:Uncharacterized protein n=1 Tax=Guyanagaster necrorhizus TaxID=856835 RepID=A0A9P7VG99_9AGAR|nr:uncharacterized protein BT62DRAFT_938358 [Guyanagaster necrorhizus MCA 3950]KAG7440154.1 hypothetical protein BT62DRAFT_938358 [Guyanagaster necrorhizus MCA 3950]
MGIFETLDAISWNLASIGGLTLDEFQTLPYKPPPDVPDASYTILHFSTAEKPAVDEEQISVNANRTLHDTCQKVFGNTGVLKFEYLKEETNANKQCILTITRPNGSMRSYQSDATFTRKTEAKAQVCQRAIEHDALQFIAEGESKLSKHLALLENEDKVDNMVPEKDPGVKAVEDWCEESNLLVKWYDVTAKDGERHGAALRILATLHSFRVYSTAALYKGFTEAKAACALVAIAEGALKFTGGASFPAPPPVGQVSLQEFYNLLPRPLPEPSLAKQNVSEVQAVGWLNQTIQSTRGSQLQAEYLPFTENSLSGCLLRIDRPDPKQCKSYIVDARFQKRGESKTAVALIAVSQGVGVWLKEVTKEINKITPEMKRIKDSFLPKLTKECQASNDEQPTFEYKNQRDAWSCTMTVNLSPTKGQRDLREFSVPTRYRNQSDAKIAACCKAANENLIDLLRFRREPSLPQYLEAKKRKREDGEVEPFSKRHKKGQSQTEPSNNMGKPKVWEAHLPARPHGHLPYPPRYTAPSPSLHRPQFTPYMPLQRPYRGPPPNRRP